MVQDTITITTLFFHTYQDPIYDVEEVQGYDGIIELHRERAIYVPISAGF